MKRASLSSFLSACDAIKEALFYSIIHLTLPRFFLKTIEMSSFSYEALEYNTNESIKVKSFAGTLDIEGASGV